MSRAGADVKERDTIIRSVVRLCAKLTLRQSHHKMTVMRHQRNRQTFITHRCDYFQEILYHVSVSLFMWTVDLQDYASTLLEIGLQYSIKWVNY